MSNPETVDLTIEFPSQDHLDDFVSWLCHCGEQSYWDSWHEDEVTPINFHYHGVENTEFPRNDKRRYGPFMADNIIRTSEREE